MIDLYSSATPNGRKITIMLEELGVEYNAIHIDLEKKEQFSDVFSKISPSNKIPVIVDNDRKITVFEYDLCVDGLCELGVVFPIDTIRSCTCAISDSYCDSHSI